MNFFTAPFEQLKGRCEGRKEKENWINKYIETLYEKLEKYDVILIPASSEIMECFEDRGIEYVLCYPKVSSKDIYIKRFKNRGTNAAWIKKIEKNYEERIMYFDSKKVEKIILEDNEFLEDKLIKVNFYKNQ